jgi:hypothetical protein
MPHNNAAPGYLVNPDRKRRRTGNAQVSATLANLMAITVMGAMNGSAFESFFSIPVEQHTGLI